MKIDGFENTHGGLPDVDIMGLPDVGIAGRPDLMMLEASGVRVFQATGRVTYVDVVVDAHVFGPVGHLRVYEMEGDRPIRHAARVPRSRRAPGRPRARAQRRRRRPVAKSSSESDGPAPPARRAATGVRAHEFVLGDTSGAA